MAAMDNANKQQFYHGTKRPIEGDMITPGHPKNYKEVEEAGAQDYDSREYAYATTDLDKAIRHSFGGKGSSKNRAVYKVEPMGDIWPDPEDGEDLPNPGDGRNFHWEPSENPTMFISRAGWKITGTVPLRRGPKGTY